jgi:hypothetical protein
MSKRLLFITAMGLMTTAFNTGNYANASDSLFPHIESKFEFPHHRWANVRQTIIIHIPGSSPALENLVIDVPENFNFQMSKIEITDRDRIVNVPIKRQGQKLSIRFDRPIASGTKLHINFNGIERNMQAPLSTYYLYGTTDGTNSFLGGVYFPRK